ncbi:MAG: hypothetical protein IKY34_04670 [Ruminiclostridium sp.]|nr:hypothetical protein [Ruminiclostridium sp.]
MYSRLLFDEPPILVLPTLAEAVGLNEAIVLQQVHYWLEKNRKDRRNIRDGYVWVYNSYSGWTEQFPWWSESTVKRIFTGLEKSGLLVSGNYNKAKMDRTKWYRIDYEKLGTYAPSGQFDPMEEVNVTRAIPETNSKTNEEKVTKAQLAELHTEERCKREARESIFQEVTREYGHDRASEMLSVVDWYIDQAYPFFVGVDHPEENKAKRMVFAQKLLECSDETMVGDQYVIRAVDRAIRNYENCNPTIYYMTTPAVLGYWLIQDEDIGYESVNDTKYAPVEAMY